MKDSIETGKGLKPSIPAIGLIIALFVLPVCSIALADQNKSPFLIHKDQRYIVKSESVRIVTAYNAGDPRQTDDTPCISANGENLCKALADGKKRCAANFVPLGHRLHVDKVGVCLVTDRTNKRYSDRVDIAMHRHEYHKALQFGRQKLNVKILELAPGKEYPVSKLGKSRKHSQILKFRRPYATRSVLAALPLP